MMRLTVRLLTVGIIAATLGVILGIAPQTASAQIGGQPTIPLNSETQETVVDSEPYDQNADIAVTAAVSANDALQQVNKAINTLIDAETEAYDYEVDTYDTALLVKGATTAKTDLEQSLADLKTIELSPLLVQLRQHVRRLDRQVGYIPQHIQAQDSNRLDTTLNGFYNTVNGYDSLLTAYARETGFEDPNYQYEYDAVSDVPLDSLTLRYAVAAWILLGVTVGATIWLFTKPRYPDSSRLRVVRLTIACTAWIAFGTIITGLAGYLISWEDTSLYDYLTVSFTAVALPGLYMYYIIVKRRTTKAAAAARPSVRPGPDGVEPA